MGIAMDGSEFILTARIIELMLYYLELIMMEILCFDFIHCNSPIINLKTNSKPLSVYFRP
jgi:hypothetical protein